MTIQSPFSIGFSVRKPADQNNVLAFSSKKAEDTADEQLPEETAKPADNDKTNESQDSLNKETYSEAAGKETSEDTQEKSKPRKTKRSKQEAEPEKNTEPDETVPITPVKYAAGKVTLDDIANRFTAIENDPKWTEFETDMRKSIDDIIIKSDINPGSARILLEQITDIAIKLNRYRAEIYTMDRLFLDRTIGLIPRFVALNSVGKNDIDRKRNAALALEAFPLPGGRTKINIADLTLAVATRKQVIDEFYENLETKKNALYSYLSIIKLESKALE